MQGFKRSQMQSGNRRPIITLKSVEAALNALVYTTTDTSAAAALRSLALVNDYLLNPARPPARDLRSFAVKAILCEIIAEELAHFRKMAGFAQMDRAADRHAALEQISQESRSNNPDFIGWSYLYHHFVRVDLGITLNDFETHCNIEGRTLRRYRQRALENLVEEIIEREWQQREKQHVRRLHAVIPRLPATNFVGRRAEIDSIFGALQKNLLSTIYISGPPGIGKTALVQRICRELINREAFDYVVWVDQPSTIDQITDAIRSAVAPQYAEVRLQEVFQVWRCLIVLDNCALNADHISAVLELLSDTTAFVTTAKVHPLSRYVHHVHLDELSIDEVGELLQKSYAHGLPNQQTDEQISKSVWHVVGGNPAALHLYVHTWIEGRNRLHSKLDLTNLYDRVYRQLSDSARQAWHFLSIVGPQSLSQDDLSALQATKIVTSRGIQELSHQYLLRVDDGAAVPHSACLFIASRYQQDSAFQEMIHGQIMAFASGMKLANEATGVDLPFHVSHKVTSVEASTGQKSHSVKQDVLEKLAIATIRCPWLNMKDKEIVALIDHTLPINPSDELAGQWLEFYNIYRHLPFRAEALAAFGICARKRQDYALAEHLLLVGIEVAGKRGDFGLQAHFVLEQAILLRLQGKYVLALQQLQRLGQDRTIVARTSLADRIHHEWAQILLELEQADTAIEHLQQIHQQKSAVWYQQYVECVRLQGNFAAAIEHALSALDDFESVLTTTERTSFYTTLGRLYMLQGESESSARWFTAALHTAEQSEQLMLMARSATNLAGALLESGELVVARQLLTRALLIQKTLRDPLGWAVTEKNMQVLRTKELRNA